MLNLGGTNNLRNLVFWSVMGVIWLSQLSWRWQLCFCDKLPFFILKDDCCNCCNCAFAPPQEQICSSTGESRCFRDKLPFFHFERWCANVAIAARSKFAVAQERAGVFGTNYLPRDLSHHFTGGPLLLVQLSDPTLPTNTKNIYIENTNTNKIAESLLILGQWHWVNRYYLIASV